MQYQVLMATPVIAVGLELIFGSLGKMGSTLISASVLLSFLAVIQDSKRTDWRRLAGAAFFSIVGAVTTSLLANGFQLGEIVASGIVGIAGARLFAGERQYQLYLGAFVGMSCIICFPNGTRLLWAAALAGLFFEYLKDTWPGVGGRLGAMAATAEIITLLLSGYGW